MGQVDGMLKELGFVAGVAAAIIVRKVDHKVTWRTLTATTRKPYCLLR